MSRYKVFETDEFSKEFKKLDKGVRKQIDNEIEQLEINPYVGKPLGFKFFREKKVENLRFYFLIYDEYVFLIAISDKKSQQSAIDAIKQLMPHYKKIVEKKFNQ